MKRIVASLAAAALALAVLLLVFRSLGHDPLYLLNRMMAGAFGSSFASAETLLKSIPLLFTALAAVIAFRAGVWNIGAEGQFLAGAVAAMAVTQALPPGGVAAAAALVASMVAGMAWASIATLLRAYRNAPEVLTTILLNFVAIHLLGWLVNGPMREVAGRYPQSDPVPAETLLPSLAGLRLHFGAVLALLAAFFVWLLLFYTRKGLELRAAGASPEAARFAGVDVARRTAFAMAVSGALAGVGGAVELLGVTGRLFERFASGAGMSGIAVALLAQLHPLGSVAAAIFFGALQSGAGELQRSAGVPAAVALLAQGVAVLAILVLGAARAGRMAIRGRFARPAEESR